MQLCSLALQVKCSARRAATLERKASCTAWAAAGHTQTQLRRGPAAHDSSQNSTLVNSAWLLGQVNGMGSVHAFQMCRETAGSVLTMP